jgi:SAM-dependent methyltransferase
MIESWVLDEGRHAGAEHLDPAYVAGYDEKAGYQRTAGPAPTAPDADLDLVRTLGVPESATVVDLGAGTGRFALAAARRFARVVAVDVSPAMAAHLAATARDAGLANVETVVAGFLSYQHTGEPAGAVYTRNALHQIPDFWKAIALQRIADLLAPGGVLRLRDLIYDFRPGQAQEVFEQWFAGAATDPALGYTRDDFIEHIRTEHSTFRWLLEPMLESAGLQVVDVTFGGPTDGAYTCVKRT